MRTCKKCGAEKALTEYYGYTQKGRRYLLGACKPCHSAAMTVVHRKSAYGMTADDYSAMLERQNGRCAICGSEDTGNKWGFAVDHDHETGQIRALLCRGCNTALGNMLDDPALLRAAADYLEEHGR